MLDVDVLDVGAEVGEAPGDVVVVADDDEGSAGEGDSGDVEGSGGSWGFEVGLVPDAGDAVGEVHVVGEERLAGGGVGAGDDPVVGAGDAAVAGGVRRVCCEGEESLEVAGGWLLVVGWVREFGLGFVEGDVGDVLLGGGEVDEGLGGRVVAPGAYGVEVGERCGREAGGEGFAVEFCGEAGGEVLEHDEGDEDGVAWGPGAGS